MFDHMLSDVMSIRLFRWLLILATKMIYLADANWITGNLCWSMPCLNGGSCFGSAYTYLCVCPTNYSGALCEKRIGICQESPCGNRGLCVETGLTSFECRCYFDYIGPLCEEHVPKDDPTVWSSLIPVHTRVLFDILQEAYRLKANGKPSVTSNNDRLDVINPIKTGDTAPSLTKLSTSSNSNVVTQQTMTTGAENVIRAEDIHLEKIFPDISTVSMTKAYRQDTSDITSAFFQTTEPIAYNNATQITSTIKTHTIENSQTTIIPSKIVENVISIALELNQTNSLNITEKQEFINSTEQNNTMTNATHLIGSIYNDGNASIEKIINNNDSNGFTINNKSQIINFNSSEASNYSSIQNDNSQFNSSEQTILNINNTTFQPLVPDISIDTLNKSKIERDQFLYQLCQQFLYQILPNASSSSSNSIQAALSLTSNSSSINNFPMDQLLSWIREQFNASTTTAAAPTETTIATTAAAAPITTTMATTASSSSSTTTTTTTTTTTAATTATTTTTTTTTTSTTTGRLSVILREKGLSTMPLQRLDMDDVLHAMNDDNDIER